jgi:hypothetical protein
LLDVKTPPTGHIYESARILVLEIVQRDVLAVLAALACFRTKAICASENFEAFIEFSSSAQQES